VKTAPLLHALEAISGAGVLMPLVATGAIANTIIRGLSIFVFSVKC
jgi:hypothetical protein